MENLPSLELMLEKYRHRLKGINTWEQIKYLGRANLERIVQLAQENILGLMADITSRDDLRLIRNGITYITDDLIPTSLKKPLLPRLRNESFRKGDRVLIYLGDTKGSLAACNWVLATI